MEHSIQDILSFTDQTAKKDFDSNLRILSFDEYLGLLARHPKRQLRGSAQYLLDLMSLSRDGGRFKIFDEPPSPGFSNIVGLENVQEELFQSLQTFANQGMNNQLILLHGPNGSAKSSLLRALMAGLENYSLQDEGSVYTFNWIFPVERYTKGGIGMQPLSSTKEPLHTFAKLPDTAIAARISCDLKDHPILLIPKEYRKTFLDRLVGNSDELWEKIPHSLREGELCHRCREIFDAVLNTSHGSLKALYTHIQVERFYFSKRYRRGLVTIEPQMHVDARYHQLTYSKSLGLLPPYLQSLNLFSVTGDLVDGNRGMIEYSDLLKRPMDSFKYLLGTCEDGSVSIENTITYLDSILIGSTNEIQLDAFKDFPDFTSFKARIALIRVPYLLQVSEEEEIYTQQLPQMAGPKHVTPHVSSSIALWAVLTRLKKPNPAHYPPHLSALVSTLSPLEKVRLYDTGQVPSRFTTEERKHLKAALPKMKDEYANVPYYEGRGGASARELKSLLFDASQSASFSCLSPLALFHKLESFVKRTSEYDFLKEEVKEGYHDPAGFIEVVRNEYLNQVDREVRDALGLYTPDQWEEFLKKYVLHISTALKKEKLSHPVTGESMGPDWALISEFERIVGAPEGSALDLFRENSLSQIGVWSLEHPNEKVVYSQVFPEFWHKLEQHYCDSQKLSLNQMHQAFLAFDRPSEESSEGHQLAKVALKGLQSKGYCEQCAKEVVVYLLRQRY